MPNPTSGRPFISLDIALPQCCPISHNPQPGSCLVIQYRAKHHYLELYSLNAYLRRFIGGFKDAQGAIIIRDMETMIQCIAQDCADMVAVPVRVEARLKLVPIDMTLLVRGYPK